jgi:hypothetical protein
VVFFECRLEQLGGELARAREEIERLKSDLAEASRREVALKQELAAAQSQAGQAARERADALEQAKVARAERERFLDRLIEAERIRRAGEPDAPEGIDLAAFIAELRSEIISLRAQATSQPRAPAPSPAEAPRAERFDSAEDAARAFAAEGRIGISERDRGELQAAAHFPTRSEETLFALSLRELSSPDHLARLRAAQRLKALGPKPALPGAAAALHGERDAEVRCALLQVLSAAGEASALPLVSPHFEAPEAEVRLAALECAFALSDRACVLRALDDASPRVRRRAAVLAAGDPDSRTALERAARDADPSVRRVAALGMAASLGLRAEEALFTALDDEDVSVRRAAAKGLSRTFGPEVFAVADLDAGRRRREIRRLSQIPADHRPALAPPLAEAEAARGAPEARGAIRRAPMPEGPSAPSAPLPEAASEPAAPDWPPVLSPELEDEVLSSVTAALRGKSPEELVRAVSAPAQAVLAAATSLEKRGRLIRRGQRYFLP